VAGLAPELVTVLELAYFEGLSASEIGARIGTPTGTVKSRLARALAHLREAIGPEGPKS
jgi:RNA polymerase sigma-70 factor (ECF subfamily)